jgi:hypothetical protein
MTIYEGDSNVWEEGMEEKEKIVLSDYETKVRLKIMRAAMYAFDCCPFFPCFTEM